MRVRATAITLLGVVLLVSSCGSGGAKPVAKPVVHHVVTPLERKIQIARSSNDLYSIFPAHPGKNRCAIPEGGAHFVPLHGMCETRVYTDIRTLGSVFNVVFTERWRFECPVADDCVAAPVLHHTWHVVEAEPTDRQGGTPRVEMTRQSGATAPQYYK